MLIFTVIVCMWQSNSYFVVVPASDFNRAWSPHPLPRHTVLNSVCQERFASVLPIIIYSLHQAQPADRCQQQLRHVWTGAGQWYSSHAPAQHEHVCPMLYCKWFDPFKARAAIAKIAESTAVFILQDLPVERYQKPVVTCCANTFD